MPEVKFLRSGLPVDSDKNYVVFRGTIFGEGGIAGWMGAAGVLLIMEYG